MSKPPTPAIPAGSLTPERAAALQFRRLIGELETAILAQPGATTDLPLGHHFATGVYVRELFIPAGTTLVGRIHKADCVNIVIGDIEVATEDGGKRLTGVNVFSSRAGTKRAGFAFSDTLWLTVHSNPSDERDGDKMADRLTVPDFETLEGSAPHLLTRE
jgi:hypothetical protein